VQAQLGVYGGKENWIGGELTAWDKNVDLSGDDVLDPDYDAAEFRGGFMCEADLAQPLTYECIPLEGKLVQGAASLTVNTLGNLVSALSEDTRCGFKAPDVIATAQVTGELGKNGGEALYTITDCVLEYPEKTEIARDCNGKGTFLEGSARVTGTLRVRGIVTGDPDEPIVPTSTEPAEIHIASAQLTNFTASDDATLNALTVVEGGISGTMNPRMGIDATNGACALSTPVVAFHDVAWTNAKALLHSDGNTFQMTLDGSTLEAQNGSNRGQVNYLKGSITVDGKAHDIPIVGAPLLDPTFNPDTFIASFACTPNLVIVDKEEQCDFQRVLGEATARLSIQTVGTLATLVNLDSSCGFNTPTVLVQPAAVTGLAGEIGTMSWNVEDCVLGSDTVDDVQQDCIGGVTYVEGHAEVQASRVVTGLREKLFVVIDSIVPKARDAVDVRLLDVALDHFVTYQVNAGETEPLGALRIETGRISAHVQPVLGERANQAGTFDVPTPVAVMSEVALTNADVALLSEGKTFKFHIDATNLHATNGSWGGTSNQVEGYVIVDGRRIDVGPMPLNPEFDGARFQDSYRCTENLKDVITE
jgi:hypothetical protein